MSESVLKAAIIGSILFVMGLAQMTGVFTGRHRIYGTNGPVPRPVAFLMGLISCCGGLLVVVPSPAVRKVLIDALPPLITTMIAMAVVLEVRRTVWAIQLERKASKECVERGRTEREDRKSPGGGVP